MSKTGVYLGVDMGATHTRLCVLDGNKNIIELTKIKTEEIVSNSLSLGLTSFVRNILDKHKLFIHRAVIGLPATISKDRKQVLSTPNLSVEKEEFSQLVIGMQSEFECPIELERDVNLQLAYDTYHLKIAKDNVLGFYLGSGFGFSIWLNGDTYVGAHGVAGELGHIPYGEPGVKCGCGNYGCLESRVSGVRLKQYFDEQNSDYSIEEFFKQKCNEAFIQNYIDDAAKAMAAAINLFDPDIVLLGGGVMDMKGFPASLLKKQISQHVRKPLPHDELTFLKATSSAFNGATGAALQALNWTH